MRIDEHPACQQVDNDQEERPEPNVDELRILEEQLAELQEQGILIPGEGKRGSLRPVAHVPGALERFLAERE